MNDAALAQIAAEMSRRDFVRLLGASMALAGATGCVRKPTAPVYPYVHPPVDGAGGELHFATAMSLDGFATGLLVMSVDGRPVKIEGNPLHPASRGASSAQQQASLLQLYDPQRARHAAMLGRDAGWDAGWDAIVAEHSVATQRSRAGSRGAGTCVIMDPTSSPLTGMLLDRFREALPDAVVHFHHSTDADTALAASLAAFGAPLIAQPDLTRVAAIATFGADPLATGPWHLRLARDFGARRRIGVSPLHAAETTPSPSGSLSGHRLAATPATLTNTALMLLRRVAAATEGSAVQLPDATLPPAAMAWVDETALDLLAHRGASLVIAGPQASTATQLAVIALNELLGNVGSTVWYSTSPIRDAGAPSHRSERLLDILAGGTINTLIVTATNPGYTVPSDLPLLEALQRAPHSLYLGEYRDETAGAAHSFAPRAHFLESWELGRAWDGTVSPTQPLIAALLGDRRTGQALLRALQPAAAAPEALRRGVVDGTASSRLTPRIRWDAFREIAAASDPKPGRIALSIQPGGVHDGRFAGNAWLQELPDPVTKLTWDNALLLAPATADRLNVRSGDVVQVDVASGRVAVPALIVPGHAENAGSLSLGYGRRGDGILERTIGVDSRPLRSVAAPFATDAAVVATGRTAALAVTQDHWSTEGRSTITAAASHPARDDQLYHAPPPTPHGFGADQWAMTIDLNLCTGCSACVVACQAENNIPVVGKRGVLNSREMHWMRINRYLDDGRGTGVVSQPMLCQHCEQAPCEYVCPVGATVHSEDGLNEMVYNRCVGTRFCSNNCPYKVRRFNWINYHEEITPVDELINNPDVTVRSRGVMEKCTFCVQRVRAAQERAELAGEPRTGPVVTACQQSCPTGAIIFGSLTNPDDPVRRSFADPRAFVALEELATKPRVRYLERDGSRKPGVSS
jgi:molybdopterin-containing oxidoreductase family iron-sulfur binding subunit